MCLSKHRYESRKVSKLGYHTCGILNSSFKYDHVLSGGGVIAQPAGEKNGVRLEMNAISHVTSASDSEPSWRPLPKTVRR